MNPFAVGYRQTLLQFLNLLLIVSSALSIWKGLSVFTNTESPIVVVLTESMEPAFSRGDLLFLHKPDRPLNVGEIIVYKLDGKEIPIVHRITRTHYDADAKEQFVLTKGDNNQADDRGIFNEVKRGKLWLKQEEVVGVVSGYAPKAGYVTILMNDNPKLKIVLLGGLALFALLTRE
ncbi:Signal peptidase complex catalytic subunit [Blastocladiella emersonii ATCC 22665]|nr:Signal peptidase complex catalytic subunit [Blastocladiella emersonii ATCC 22665]